MVRPRGSALWQRMEYDRAREVELELSHARGDAGEALVGCLLVGHTAEVANLSRFRLIVPRYPFEFESIRFEVNLCNDLSKRQKERDWTKSSLNGIHLRS